MEEEEEKEKLTDEDGSKEVATAAKLVVIDESES